MLNANIPALLRVITMRYSSPLRLRSLNISTPMRASTAPSERQVISRYDRAERERVLQLIRHAPSSFRPDGGVDQGTNMGSIEIKRVYEPCSRGDGERILVDRLWPRGLRKTD